MSDEVTKRNILAIKKHSEDTRVMLRELEQKVVHLKQKLDMAQKDNIDLRLQVQKLQIKLYSGGATA